MSRLICSYAMNLYSQASGIRGHSPLYSVSYESDKLLTLKLETDAVVRQRAL